ncbi:hypothetical protein [Plantactinospora sp. CA-290183]|uniref:hypothetical protein n=1 Tax=Plantactinospora sp. CA-290183 TaxID=3240006 RepID=UPI003D8C1FD0
MTRYAMHDDPVGRLTELWQRADVLAQRLAAVTRPDGSWDGSDGTGMVTVTVDAEGPVAAVAVEPQWRRRIDPEALGTAVREAAGAAQHGRLTDWAESFAEQHARPDPLPRPMPPLQDTLANRLDELATAGVSGDEGRAGLRELSRLVGSAVHAVGEVSAQLRVHARTTYTGHNQSRDVAVTVSGGGEVTEVRYDRHWLAEAGGQWIGRETVSAFRAAYQRASAESVEAVIARGPLGEIQELGADPHALARRLHLR